MPAPVTCAPSAARAPCPRTCSAAWRLGSAVDRAHTPMKSMNISSATGRSPVSAAPTTGTEKPISLMGVSSTRPGRTPSPAPGGTHDAAPRFVDALILLARPAARDVLAEQITVGIAAHRDVQSFVDGPGGGRSCTRSGSARLAGGPRHRQRRHLPHGQHVVAVHHHPGDAVALGADGDVDDRVVTPWA